jgi:VanZ family protein
MLAIFVMSAQSHIPDLGAAGGDKFLHTALYAGLCALIVRALAGGWRQPVTRRIAWMAALVAVAYAVTDEVHQHFVPLRQMDAADLVADAGGAALASAALYVRAIIRARHGL